MYESLPHFGIVLHPAGHTLSPMMHRAAYEAFGIEATYDVFDMESEDLEDFMDRVRMDPEFLDGFSVSIPHKENIAQFLDELVDQATKDIGAVNTVYWDGEKLVGTNTDWQGAMIALTEGMGEEQIAQKKVLVVGAGGASRAMVYGLKVCGAEVTIVNRTPEKAFELADFFGVHGKPLGGVDSREFDVIVQTTSVGLNTNESLFLPEHFKKDQVVMDMVYQPRETQFLKYAKQAGATIITGEKMLIAQGALQFQIWFGESVSDPRMVMTKSVEKILGKKC